MLLSLEIQTIQTIQYKCRLKHNTHTHTRFYIHAHMMQNPLRFYFFIYKHWHFLPETLHKGDCAVFLLVLCCGNKNKTKSVHTHTHSCVYAHGIKSSLVIVWVLLCSLPFLHHQRARLRIIVPNINLYTAFKIYTRYFDAIRVAWK